MKQRVEAGSDVAMIGAWDASRNALVPFPKWGKEFELALERDVAAGHLFLIRIGGDGGGAIDIYVDTEVPEDARQETRPVDRAFLISVPTGQLIVAGMEDYRSSKPQTSGPNSVISIAPGDYSLRCHLARDLESGLNPPSESELQQALGAEDHEYYRRISKLSRLGFLTLLLFPLLIFWLKWPVALGITAAVLVAYFWIQEQVLLRNTRYRRVYAKVDQAWKRSHDASPPWMVFELRRIADKTGLQGGTVRLDKE